MERKIGAKKLYLVNLYAIYILKNESSNNNNIVRDAWTAKILIRQI